MHAVSCFDYEVSFPFSFVHFSVFSSLRVCVRLFQIQSTDADISAQRLVELFLLYVLFFVFIFNLLTHKMVF